MPTDYEPPILLRYSPLYNELAQQHELLKQQEGLPLFFVLKDKISAKDAIKTIETFDFDKKFLKEQIIFLENTSGKHWDVVVKDKADYIPKTIKPKDTSFTALKKLQDTRKNEFQGILIENKWLDSVKCNRPLEQCFENNKTREFHVRTLFCNYLSDNLHVDKSLATLDLEDLIINGFGNGFNELKFNKTDKFDFRYLFPVDERDLSKVKTFYCDREDGGEQMITKVVKILDKYYEDHEREKNIQGKVIQEKDIETFLIVERAIAQIIETKNKFGEDCQFPDKDYRKIENFSKKYSKSEDNKWNFFSKPFEDLIKLFSNSGGDVNNAIPDNVGTAGIAKPSVSVKSEGSQEENKPSSILGGIIDAIAVFCGSRKGNEKGR